MPIITTNKDVDSIVEVFEAIIRACATIIRSCIRECRIGLHLREEVVDRCTNPANG